MIPNELEWGQTHLVTGRSHAKDHYGVEQKRGRGKEDVVGGVKHVSVLKNASLFIPLCASTAPLDQSQRRKEVQSSSESVSYIRNEQKITITSYLSLIIGSKYTMCKSELKKAIGVQSAANTPRPMGASMPYHGRLPWNYRFFENILIKSINLVKPGEPINLEHFNNAIESDEKTRGAGSEKADWNRISVLIFEIDEPNAHMHTMKCILGLWQNTPPCKNSNHTSYLFAYKRQGSWPSLTVAKIAPAKKHTITSRKTSLTPRKNIIWICDDCALLRHFLRKIELS